MQWVPQKPATHRVKLIAFTIAAIPIVCLGVLIILGLMSLAELPN